MYGGLHHPRRHQISVLITALHKIFADNGISYSTAGINTGNYSGGVAAPLRRPRIQQRPFLPGNAPAPYEIAGRADGVPTTDALTVPDRASNWLA